MNKTEGAKEFEIKLREIYDNRVKNDSLMILFNKVINSQPPNLDMKCNDKWEPLNNPHDKYDEFEIVLHFEEVEIYNKAKTYRQRIEELEKENESLHNLLMMPHNELQQDNVKLTKERDELKLENGALLIQLLTEKSKVKERDVAISKLKRFVSEHEFYTITKELTTKEQ